MSGCTCTNIYLKHLMVFLIEALPYGRTNHIQNCLVYILTIRRIRPIRTQNVDILSQNIVANRGAGTSERSNFRLILRACLPIEVFE